MKPTAHSQQDGITIEFSGIIFIRRASQFMTSKKFWDFIYRKISHGTMKGSKRDYQVCSGSSVTRNEILRSCFELNVTKSVTLNVLEG